MLSVNKTKSVTLTADQRASLRRRIAAGSAPARARILLKADGGPHGPGWTDGQIAMAMDVGHSTVARVRRRFIDDGIDAAIRRRPPRREYRTRLDGEQEAHLVALAGGSLPLGRRRWTLRLLTDKLVELRYIDGVSYETVRRVLKKNEL